jgi:hypothetical protein
MTARAIARRIGIAVALVAACASRGLAQPAENPPAAAANVLRNDSDPTRPVLFSLRPEIYSPNRDVTQTALIFRYDRAQLRQRRWLPGKRGVISRFEMPLTTTAVSGGATQVGLGDAYAQLLVSPYFTRTFAFVVGTGLRVPTATDPLLGTGKWIIAPAAAPVWFFSNRGIFLVKLQNFSSFAGDAQRPNYNFFLLTPTYVHTLSPRWWILLDGETKTDWERSNATSVKGGVQIGRAYGRRFSTWVKPEVTWVSNQDNQWNLKFGLVWFR